MAIAVVTLWLTYTGKRSFSFSIGWESEWFGTGKVQNQDIWVFFFCRYPPGHMGQEDRPGKIRPYGFDVTEKHISPSLKIDPKFSWIYKNSAGCMMMKWSEFSHHLSRLQSTVKSDSVLLPVNASFYPRPWLLQLFLSGLYLWALQRLWERVPKYSVSKPKALFTLTFYSLSQDGGAAASFPKTSCQWRRRHRTRREQQPDYIF